MILGAPAFLFALAALLVPVIIHLWSKNTRDQVAFGSVRFLTETVTKTTRQFFPSDLLLLLIRCLCIVLLVLILTEPSYYQEKSNKTAFLIDPVLQENPEKIKNSLPENAEVFWLSDTKTPVTDSLKNLRRNLWLDYSAFADYDSLVVFSPRNLSQFHGKRIFPKRKITWIIPPASEVSQSLAVVRKNDTNHKIIENSNQNQTLFRVEETTSDGEVLPVTVFIHSSEKYQEFSGLITAALEAIAKNGLITLTIKPWSGEMHENDWLIWLDDDQPEWRKNLIYITGNQNELISNASAGIFTIKTAGTDEMLRENLPLQLEQVLHETFLDDLEVTDLRMLPESQLWSSAYEKSQDQKAAHSVRAKASLARAGWIILIFLVLTERVFSHLKAKK